MCSYSTFPFSLWTWSVWLSPVSKVRTVFHSTELLCHFWIKGKDSCRGRAEKTTDNSSRNTAALFPLPLRCSLPSALVLGQVGEGSCCWVMRTGHLVIQVYGGYSAALQHCAVCVWVHEHLPVSFLLWNYPEWDYPKCGLTFNRKTSVKRLPDLTPGHLWTAL